MARFDGADVPQKSLDAIRRLLAGVAAGHVGPALEAASGLKARHLAYTLRAARSLGLLDDAMVPTAQARAVLDEAPWSAGERAAWRAAIERTALFQQLFPDLFAPRAPDLDTLGARIVNHSTLAPTTARRRAQDILGWRRRLLSGTAEQLELLSPRRALSPDAIIAVRRANPWWAGEAMRPALPFRRSFVATAQRRLAQGLAPIVVIKGPRQVGKSIAQEQMIADLLASGVAPKQIFRIQFDDVPALRKLSPQPILDLIAWYERDVLGTTLNGAASAGRPTFLFVDEAQNVPDWSIQLKSLVDLSALRVVLTGSSALRIQASADSLAGRTTTIEVSTLGLAEIAAIRGLGTLRTLLANGAAPLRQVEEWHRLVRLGTEQEALLEQAFSLFLERGGYPRCHVNAEMEWAEVAPSLKADVIEKAIGHDARVGQTGRGRARRADVLEGVFRHACRHAGRSVREGSISQDLTAEGLPDVTPELVHKYLEWFEGALLLRLVRPLEARKRKTFGGNKLCLVDHGLRQVYLADDLPLSPARLADFDQSVATEVGDVVESIVGAALYRLAGASVAWHPQRDGEPEVDFVLTVGDQRIPIEVKYRRTIRKADFAGLTAFLGKPANRASFGVIVTQSPQELVDPRIIAVPLATLLLLSP